MCHMSQEIFHICKEQMGTLRGLPQKASGEWRVRADQGPPHRHDPRELRWFRQYWSCLGHVQGDYVHEQKAKTFKTGVERRQKLHKKHQMIQQ